jgi:hypothetical protein
VKIINAGLLCLAICAAATPAHAQTTWTDQGFVNVNVGFQTGSRTLSVTSPFEIYGETGTVSSATEVSSGAMFDFSGGYKVWRNMAIGAGFSTTGGSSDAAVTANVPDPLVFNQLRTVNSTVTDLNSRENTFYITGTWMVPVTTKIDVGVSFGPAFFSVKQDVPTSVTVTEPGPTINQASGEVSESGIGIHFGVDATYLVTPRIGVGALARYTRGSVDIEGAAENLTVGGFQLGVGARFRF